MVAAPLKLMAHAALLLCMYLATPAVALMCYKGEATSATLVEVTDDHCIAYGYQGGLTVVWMYDSGTLQDCTRLWVRPDTNGVHCCATARCNEPSQERDAVEFERNP
jgi:hypothetical protein